LIALLGKSASAKAMSSNSAKPPQSLKEGTYTIEKRIGAGCFGDVWLGHIAATKEPVAVKFEDVMASSRQLEQEYLVIRMLCQPTRPQGVVASYYYGQEGRFNCLVMELLGKSLEDRMKSQHGKFDIQTTVLVAEQLLNRIEYLHSKAIVHRDIKPENFMFGRNERIAHLYVIDFGLSKRYWTSQHTICRTKLSLTGTARYASINAHNGLEQSRRDDLEAIGHMLFYFIRGQLPWSGLPAKTQEEKYRKICEKKKETLPDELCKGFPDAFKIYLMQARALEFKERPDYDGYRKLFSDVRATFGNIQDYDFAWMQGKDLKNLVLLEGNDPAIRQPDDVTPVKKSGGGIWSFSCFACGKASSARE
jgi:serine/threonine protein kinase